VPSARTQPTATLDDDGEDAAEPAINRGRFAVMSWLVRPLRRHTRDSIGILAAVLASLAVLMNALFLQSGPHPAPIFTLKPRPVTSGDATGSVVTPRPRPAELGGTRPDPPAPRDRADIMKAQPHGPASAGAAGAGPAGAGAAGAGPAGAAARNDAIGDLIATSSRRVLAVQRALADFGYGPVKPSGVLGPDTKAAIEKFERDRRMPVTGQISERLMHELAAVTGRTMDQRD